MNWLTFLAGVVIGGVLQTILVCAVFAFASEAAANKQDRETEDAPQ